jgi:CRP-like cAMP-binding protein
MKDLSDILAVHPFCQGLDPSAVDLLVGCATNVRFEADEILFRTGDAADRFFILRSGEVAIEIHAPGRGRITVETVGEGSVIGWSWLVPPHRWLFDGRAVTLCRAIALDGACLRGKCEENHDLGYELLKRVALVVGERLAAARLQLLDVYGRPTEESP